MKEQNELLKSKINVNDTINELLFEFLKSEVMEDIRNEMYYLIKIVKLNIHYRHINGNLINYDERSGIMLNHSNVKLLIQRKKLLFTPLVSAIKINNSKWLEEYFKLHRKLYNINSKKVKQPDLDETEYYIAEAISYNHYSRINNKKVSFLSFSKNLKIPRSTLKDRLNRLGIYKKVISILKLTEKS